MTLGYGLMIMLDERSSLYVFRLLSCTNSTQKRCTSALQVIYPLIAGLGVGGLFYPPLTLMQAAMPVKDMATTTATLGLLRQLGATVGISIGQAIWSTVRYLSLYNARPLTTLAYQDLRKRIAMIPGAAINTSSGNLADSIRQIKNLEVSIRLLPSFLRLIGVDECKKPESLRLTVQHAYTKSIAVIWIVDTPLIGLCLILGKCHYQYNWSSASRRCVQSASSRIIRSSEW